VEHDEVSEKLIAALPWNARRTQLEPVLKSATLALKALSKLDEYIFEKRTGSGGLVVDALARTKKDKDGKAGRFLRGVASTMWEGAKTFIYVVDKQLGAHMDFSDEPELDLDALDFDFAPPSTDVTSIGEDDIEGALDFLGNAGSDEVVELGDVANATVPLANALQEQLAAAKTKLVGALEDEDFALAVQVLDRTRDGLEEAIFAVVEAIFELHHAPLSRKELVPGYQSALDEALNLRKAIAELRRGVARDNDRIKDGDDTSYARVRRRMVRFVKDRAFTLMRAADRMQMLELYQRVRAGDDAKVVEGLAKYLDSLSAINEREVLVQHDRRVRTAARESLESARSLFEISPRAAADQVADAYYTVRTLEGWRDDLDELLGRWAQDPQRRLDDETAEVWADRLLPMLG
jgi:hypothetical protein